MAAMDWPRWDSKEDFAGKKQPAFRLRYLREERVLIIEGRARLTPIHGGGAPFEIRAGDCVTYARARKPCVRRFRAGFVPTDLLTFPLSSLRVCRFRAGFVAGWQVLDRMRKHYRYFDETGRPTGEPCKATPVIACDGCGKECVEESYLGIAEDGKTMDICPRCLGKARGSEKRRFADALPCKLGVPAHRESAAVAEPAAKRGKAKVADG